MRSLVTTSLFTWLLILSATGASAQKKYTKVDGGYMMVLREGDNVFNELESLAKAENIPSAVFTAIGFAEIEFGFFNYKTRSYKKKKMKGGEVAPMFGSLAWKENKPSVHAHGVLTTKKFKAYGGHILSAIVGKGSLEIKVNVHDKKFARLRDEQLGADVLCIDNCPAKEN